jgi:hypothetical protein
MALPLMSLQYHCNHESHEAAYRFEKAPKSANRASTPVNASKIPPSDFQPSVLFLTKYRPAKYGENAFKTEWSNFARFWRHQSAAQSG